MNEQNHDTTPDERFVVRELDARCFVVDDTATAMSYDMRFTRRAAQGDADRRNALLTHRRPPGGA